MTKRLPFPSVGDRINCDPNRDEGDVPHRWTNPNRESALVVARFADDIVGECFVYRVARPGHYPRFRVMTELDWECLNHWEIGPLPKAPRSAKENRCR